MAYNTNNNVLAASLFITALLLFSAPSSANGQPPDSVALNVTGTLCCTPGLSCPGRPLVGEVVTLNCLSNREVVLQMATDALGLLVGGLVELPLPELLSRSTKVPCDLSVRYPFRSTTSCLLPDIPADVPDGYLRTYLNVGAPLLAGNGINVLNAVPGRLTFVN